MFITVMCKYITCAQAVALGLECLYTCLPDLIDPCVESKVEWGNASVYSLQDSGMLSTRSVLSVTEELMLDLR